MAIYRKEKGHWVIYQSFVTTADLVEVIRCRDCKFAEKPEYMAEHWNHCTKYDSNHYDDFFCESGDWKR